MQTTHTRSTSDFGIAPGSISVQQPTIADQIHGHLVLREADLRHQFTRKHGPVQARFCVLDNLLPESLVRDIHDRFPPHEQMRLMSTFRESKYTSKALDKMDELIRDALYAFQDPRVLDVVGRITGMPRLLADPSLYAGGISSMTKGQFLNPHLDNSHEGTRSYYRRLNALFYVTPYWDPKGGGNLELWDNPVRQAIEIPSLFNRLVIMETNRTSWHSVNPVNQAGARCCVSNYYFTETSPEAYDYFHVTTFSARPEQPLTRLRCRVDNLLRSAVRVFKKDGLGKKDVYEQKKAA